jgi:hypothetical protein
MSATVVLAAHPGLRPGHRVLRNGPHPVRAVLARHASIDEKTGQLTEDKDGGPRRLVISSDFYAVYQSAGKKAAARRVGCVTLENIWCRVKEPCSCGIDNGFAFE